MTSTIPNELSYWYHPESHCVWIERGEIDQDLFDVGICEVDRERFFELLLDEEASA